MKQEIILALSDQLKTDATTANAYFNLLFVVEDLPVQKDVVKINILTGKAQTQKLKNLTCNLKKLSVDALEIGVGIAGAVSTPWLIPFAALVGINKLVTGTTINLAPEHAIMLQGMWMNEFQNGNIINHQNGFTLVNNEFVRVGRQPISISHFNLLVTELVALKTLRLRNDEIWLIETIHFNISF